MQKIQKGSYEIVLTGKADGNSRDADFVLHKEFLSIHQIHKNKIYEMHDGYVTGHRKEIEGDAIITSGNVGVGVHVADCVPIAILGKDIYAIVHGSWKTLYVGIIQDTVKNMCRHGENVVDMSVYIGPCIRKESYEVGDEFKEMFPKDVLDVYDGKLCLDLIGYTCLLLEQEGIEEVNINIHPDDTYVSNERFSYRGGNKEGRNFMGVRKRV